MWVGPFDQRFGVRTPKSILCFDLNNRIVASVQSSHGSRWMTDDMEMGNRGIGLCYEPYALFLLLSFPVTIFILCHDSDSILAGLGLCSIYIYPLVSTASWCLLVIISLVLPWTSLGYHKFWLAYIPKSVYII